MEIKNLTSLRDILIDKLNCDFENVYITGFDLNYYTNNHIVHHLNLKNSPKIQIEMNYEQDLYYYEYKYDIKNLNWKIKKLNLNKNCIDRSNLPRVNLNKTTYNPFDQAINYDPLSDDGLPLDLRV